MVHPVIRKCRNKGNAVMSAPDKSAAAKKITHFKYYTLLLLRGLEGSIIHDNLHYPEMPLGFLNWVGKQ